MIEIIDEVEDLDWEEFLETLKKADRALLLAGGPTDPNAPYP